MRPFWHWKVVEKILRRREGEDQSGSFYAHWKKPQIASIRSSEMLFWQRVRRSGVRLQEGPL